MKTAFSGCLKEAIELGHTQREIAAAVGITEASVINYKHGNMPMTDISIKLAEWFTQNLGKAVTVEKLFAEVNEGGGQAEAG